MKIFILLITLFFSIPSFSYADKVLRHIPTGSILMTGSDKSNTAIMIANGVGTGIPANELEVVVMSSIEAREAISSAEFGNNVIIAQIKKIADIRREAKSVLQNMTGYALGNATQRSNIQNALRQAYLDAKALVSACVDIPCVKAVQPSWPADPGE